MSGVDASARSVAWEAWCGRDLVRDVAIVTPDGVVFASRDATERALTLWRDRRADVAEVAARSALARLIARGVGTTEIERALLARVLGAASERTDVRIIRAPEPPSAPEVGESLRRLPRDEWSVHLDSIRRTFFPAYDTLDEFAAWLVRELWRAGALP